MDVRWLLVLALLPLAQAYTESEASTLDERIVSVSHEPAVPEPGQQWTGQIELAVAVDAVHYQICRVGNACFGPPTPATESSPNVWSFDTANYALDFEGNPVSWGINEDDDSEWLIGVKYVLINGNETEELPHGRDDCIEVSSEEYVACDSTHYFTFTMPGQAKVTERGAPAPMAILLLALLVLARRDPQP